MFLNSFDAGVTCRFYLSLDPASFSLFGQLSAVALLWRCANHPGFQACMCSLSLFPCGATNERAALQGDLERMRYQSESLSPSSTAGNWEEKGWGMGE